MVDRLITVPNCRIKKLILPKALLLKFPLIELDVIRLGQDAFNEEVYTLYNVVSNLRTFLETLFKSYLCK